MFNIIYQITIALNLMLGGGNHQQEACKIYQQGAYHIEAGVVIIDTDEM